MKITALWVYPIKALRGIQLSKATLGPQGLEHDRRFILFKVVDKSSGELKKIQLDSNPECALFTQEIKDDAIVRVKYLKPKEQPIVPWAPEQDVVLEVPLRPDYATLEKMNVNLHQSWAVAYRMGDEYDAWFSACFGFDMVLVYIGDGRRPVLGTFSPKSAAEQKPSSSASPASSSWLSSVTSYISGSGGGDDDSKTTDADADIDAASEPDWLNFSDCAPYLIATEASLRNVQSRLPSVDVPMFKFRPNIVVDADQEGKKGSSHVVGDANDGGGDNNATKPVSDTVPKNTKPGVEEWDEDFWSELRVAGSHTLALTKLCNRCSSLNVDYGTGRMGAGEEGTVLKKLMADRRVDLGLKYNPTFGRYAFLTSSSPGSATTERGGGEEGGDEGRGSVIKIGDSVHVTKRLAERPVWDWPMRDTRVARYYEGREPQGQQQQQQ